MKSKYILCSFILVLLVILTSIVGTRFLKYHRELSSLDNTIAKEVIVRKEGKELTATTFEEVNRYINENKKSMLIIGKSGCTYCNMYLPVVRSASKEYGFDYMYVDLALFNNTDYKTLLNNDNILIPSKCSDYGEDSKLNKGFGTPITLIIEDGKPYDCIRGYKSNAIVYETLVNAKYIEN